MNIYVASSWRNRYQPGVVEFLRARGCQVYDFRHPPNRTGFAWRDIEAGWESWSLPQYLRALRHPAAEAGYAADMQGVHDADACVLVLPCGRSAHLEAGYMAGAGKPVIIYLPEKIEPELMYKMAHHIAFTLPEIERGLHSGGGVQASLASAAHVSTNA